jgi:hypothetical protein
MVVGGVCGHPAHRSFDVTDFIQLVSYGWRHPILHVEHFVPELVQPAVLVRPPPTGSNAAPNRCIGPARSHCEMEQSHILCRV